MFGRKERFAQKQNTIILIARYKQIHEHYSQVRPTCSESCGTWTKRYPKGGAKKRQKRPKSDDQLTISLIWEYSFQLMPIRKLKKKDETGDVIILLS